MVLDRTREILVMALQRNTVAVWLWPTHIERDGQTIYMYIFRLYTHSKFSSRYNSMYTVMYGVCIQIRPSHSTRVCVCVCVSNLTNKAAIVSP